MRILTTVQEMRSVWREAKDKKQSVGLVPTMGALHKGHASLIEAARAENDLVVMSLFVNPTQFAPTEDLAAYPRDLQGDAKVAEAAGADIIFAPAVSDMYPEGDSTWVEVSGHLTSILCGRSRPGHFRGVSTVVTKLFNIVRPDRAYFGQKDGQQAQIIRRMTVDLFMPIDIRIMPLIREDDGLALSSRNSYLSAEERRAALVLSHGLKEAEELIRGGERNKEVVLAKLKSAIEAEPLADLNYAEIYTFPELGEFDGELKGSVFIALAVKFGGARLIDNVVVEAPAAA